VAKAQFGRLDGLLAARRNYATMLSEGLRDIADVTLPQIVPGSTSSWWFYMFRLTPGAFRGNGSAFARALSAEGTFAMAGYIPRPIYREPLFAEKSFFPRNIWPAEVVSGRSYSYVGGICPVAEEVLNTAIRLPVNEFYTEQDAADTVAAVHKVAAGLRC